MNTTEPTDRRRHGVIEAELTASSASWPCIT